MSRIKPVIIIQGGQYGSEAKGLITHKVGLQHPGAIYVRTGTVNAGHTVKYGGRAYAMQQLPVGWVDPTAILVLGPGAYIAPDILEREIGWINDAMPGEPDVRGRIYIDSNCGLHLTKHTDRAKSANRHHKMGATGKGCSEAVMDKIRGRGEPNLPLFHRWVAGQAGDDHWTQGLAPFVDVSALLNSAIDRGEQVIIEGTQGTLLDLHLGPYPYTTHKQTQAASWLAECGISPTLPVNLVSVMRTCPIRVAGNSGPLPDEMTWAQLARHINFRLTLSGQPDLVAPLSISQWEMAVDREFGAGGDPAHWTQHTREMHQELASEGYGRAWRSLSPIDQGELAKLFEMTTVTKKLRRIAQWNVEEAKRSVALNRPTSVALTFLNYVFPEAWGVTRATFGELPAPTRRAIYLYVRAREEEMGTPISLVGFGPDLEHTWAFYPDEIDTALAVPLAMAGKAEEVTA